jgi:hypothetical protein
MCYNWSIEQTTTEDIMTSKSAQRADKKQDIYVRWAIAELTRMVTDESVDEATKEKVTELLDTLDPDILDEYFDRSDTERAVFVEELSGFINELGDSKSPSCVSDITAFTDIDSVDIPEIAKLLAAMYAKTAGMFEDDGQDVTNYDGQAVTNYDVGVLDGQDVTNYDGQDVTNYDGQAVTNYDVGVLDEQTGTEPMPENTSGYISSKDYNIPPKFDGDGSSYETEQPVECPPVQLFDASLFIDSLGDGDTTESDVSADDAS